MSSQVFYRKWRPQTMAEVVGQEHITQTLRHAVDSGRVAHAYLFCGPRGTGKTSTGRILAKAVNCLEPAKGEPCNTCDMCHAVNEGNALDIIEVDAASNRGIDEIRDLREKVNYAPNIARYKVYIIDEAHMITKDGSNAFLKTLEEPPHHAIFILATTEPHKILPTILSRCQRFDFHRLSQSAVISKLKLICDKENINIEPESLRLITKVTTGSLRDAENLLEQSVAYYGQKIELHQVQEMLGISGDLRIRELAKYVLNKDIPAGLKTINNVSSDGLDLRQFNRELVDYLRELLLVKSDSEEVVDATSEDLAEMKRLAVDASLDYLVIAVKLFGEIDLRLDNYSSLPLELALVECILSATGKQPAPLDAEGPEKLTKVTSPPAKSAKPSPKPKTLPITEIVETPAAETIEAPELESVAKNSDVKLSGEVEQLRGRWKEFVNAMRGEGSKGNLDAFLRSACEPLDIEDGILILGFYHKFQKDYIEDPKYKHLVEKKLREVFGKPYQVRCVLTPPPQKAKSAPVKESPVVKIAKEEYGARVISEKSEMEEE